VLPEELAVTASRVRDALAAVLGRAAD
jgi:hypothetical protein